MGMSYCREVGETLSFRDRKEVFFVVKPVYMDETQFNT